MNQGGNTLISGLDLPVQLCLPLRIEKPGGSVNVPIGPYCVWALGNSEDLALIWEDGLPLPYYSASDSDEPPLTMDPAALTGGCIHVLNSTADITLTSGSDSTFCHPALN